MAVVAVEGFDLYNGTGANTGMSTRWVIANFSASSSAMATGRFGGQCWQTNAFNGQASTATMFLPIYPSTHTNITVGVAVKFSTMADNSFLLICKDAGTTAQLTLTYTAAGAVKVFRGSTLLGTSVANVIRLSTWHFIEFSSVSHASTGTAVVKVDGATILNLTAQNTVNQSAAGVNTIVLNGTGSTSFFDDIYVLDSTTSLGECRVETLRANGDTATADWTPNSGATGYTQVDETLANGDTDYVQSTNVGDHSLFDMTNLSTTPTAIYAVSPVLFAEKTDSATRTLLLTMQSSGTDEDGTAVNLSASYNAYRRIDEVDPHTSTAWTKTTVDAVKVGPKVAS